MDREAEDERSVLWRSLQALSNDEGIRRANLVELLRDELDVLRQVWALNLDNSVEDIRRSIEANLYALILQLEPRPANQRRTVEQRKRQYRNSVAVSFNLFSNPELQGFKLQDRHSWLAHKDPKDPLHITVTTSRRDLNHAIGQIERILTSGYQPVGAPGRDADKTLLSNQHSAVAVRQVLADEYVARPQYEAEIRQLRDMGTRRISLHGDAGTGKTRLARAANRDVISEIAVAILPANEKDQLVRHLTTFLALHVETPENISPTNVWAVFGRALKRNVLPQVIVFDDMTAENLAEVPDVETHSILIFTSVRPLPEAERGHPIDVGEMVPAEAREMIRSRLPKSDEKDIRRLIEVLGGRPLALEHSCAFLRETRMPVSQYCEAVARKPDTVLDAAGERYGRTLTRAYQMTIDALASAPENLRALDYLLFTRRNVMTVKMLTEMWADRPQPPSELWRAVISDTSEDFISMIALKRAPGIAHMRPIGLTYIDPVVAVSLYTALRQLEDFGLVRSENGILVIHQLTWSLLRALRSGSEQAVYERIRSTVYRLVQLDVWEIGEAVPWERSLWTFHLIDALADLNATASDRIDDMTDDEVNQSAVLIGFFLRSARQLGLRMYYCAMQISRILNVVITRVISDRYDEQSRRAVLDSYVRLYEELGVLGVADAFDVSQDGGKKLGYLESAVGLKSRDISARLRNDTEWLLAHQITNADHWLSQVNSFNLPIHVISLAESDRKWSDVRVYKEFARTSVEAATIHYHACRWNDAIAALEHAYSCYVKIGGDAECTRGILDTARRLARVHLRAGQLETAKFWLIRAHWMFVTRSEARPNGFQLRYRLNDVILGLQLSQVLTQIELTEQIDKFEADDSDNASGLLEAFVRDRYNVGIAGKLSSQSRLETAKREVDYITRLDDMRLLPEALMHVYRLDTLAALPINAKAIKNLSEWFTSRGLTYQSDLLSLQMEVVASPIVAALADFEATEAHHLLKDVPSEARELVLEKLQYRTAYSQGYYEHVRRMRDVHGNLYWYARGLCGCFMVAQGAQPRHWMDGLRLELESAARQIGRPDWIERTYAFPYTDTGWWLLGY